MKSTSSEVFECRNIWIMKQINVYIFLSIDQRLLTNFDRYHVFFAEAGEHFIIGYIFIKGSQNIEGQTKASTTTTPGLKMGSFDFFEIDPHMKSFCFRKKGR